MKKILVVDDEKAVRNVLSIALSDKGYTVHEAKNGKQGFEMFKKTNPDIIITDVKMPEMDGIEFTKQIKGLKGDVDVIIMTGYGTEELVVEALRSGASNYIKKPIGFDELFKILENIILKREHRKRFEIIKDVVVYEQKDMIIGNDISIIWGIINQILINVHSGTSHKIVEGIRIGLYEILANAIEHGNLGISFEEKSEALHNSSYAQILTERMREADQQGKKIFIHCTYNRDEISIEVKDQGKGFNLDELPDMNDPEVFMSAHGRGILLTSLYFDKINYKEPGNCVQLVKKLHREPPDSTES